MLCLFRESVLLGSPEVVKLCRHYGASPVTQCHNGRTGSSHPASAKVAQARKIQLMIGIVADKNRNQASKDKVCAKNLRQFRAIKKKIQR